jgi:hypothetical protein
MRHKTLLITGLLLASGLALGQDKGKGRKEETEAKEVSGMSIVGNNETPKSLTIIPWKSSEIGQETSFSSSLLNQDMVPVDKAAFQRELEFYKLSNPN